MCDWPLSLYPLTDFSPRPTWGPLFIYPGPPNLRSLPQFPRLAPYPFGRIGRTRGYSGRIKQISALRRETKDSDVSLAWRKFFSFPPHASPEGPLGVPGVPWGSLGVPGGAWGPWEPQGGAQGPQKLIFYVCLGFE